MNKNSGRDCRCCEILNHVPTTRYLYAVYGRVSETDTKKTSTDRSLLGVHVSDGCFPVSLSGDCWSIPIQFLSLWLHLFGWRIHLHSVIAVTSEQPEWVSQHIYRTRIRRFCSVQCDIVFLSSWPLWANRRRDRPAPVPPRQPPHPSPPPHLTASPADVSNDSRDKQDKSTLRSCAHALPFPSLPFSSFVFVHYVRWPFNPFSYLSSYWSSHLSAFFLSPLPKKSLVYKEHTTCRFVNRHGQCRTIKSKTKRMTKCLAAKHPMWVESTKWSIPSHWSEFSKEGRTSSWRKRQHRTRDHGSQLYQLYHSRNHQQWTKSFDKNSQFLHCAVRWTRTISS